MCGLITSRCQLKELLAFAYYGSIEVIALDKVLFSEKKNVDIFLISSRKHMLWVHQKRLADIY